MRQTPQIAQVLAGIAVLAVLHIVFSLFAYLLAIVSSSIAPSNQLLIVPLFLVFAIGISQLLYVLPLCIWLNRRRQLGMRNGVIIGAVLTALLNGSCFIYLLNVW